MATEEETLFMKIDKRKIQVICQHRLRLRKRRSTEPAWRTWKYPSCIYYTPYLYYCVDFFLKNVIFLNFIKKTKTKFPWLFFESFLHRLKSSTSNRRIFFLQIIHKKFPWENYVAKKRKTKKTKREAATNIMRTYMKSIDFHTPVFITVLPLLSSCDTNLQCYHSMSKKVFKERVNFVNSHHKRTKIECAYYKKGVWKPITSKNQFFLDK